jgi:hypothetical protein
MNYRDVAIAMETEARLGQWQAIMEGSYQKFDELVTTRSVRPWSIAWYIFSSGSDRQVRQLAALWLFRHDRDQADWHEPDVNPELATMLDQALEEVQYGNKKRP